MFPDSFERAISRLENDIYGSITHLQFYDRMVQHLTLIQTYLSGVSGQLAEGATTGSTDEGFWVTLHAQLRSRLISANQRELLDAILPPPAGAQRVLGEALEEAGAPGVVELF